METRQEVDLLERTIASQGGKLDALIAAVEGMLQVSKGNPELAKAVSARLEQQHSEILSRPENSQYVQSFEVMRSYLLSMVE
jgi:hypothetical protein